MKTLRDTYLETRGVLLAQEEVHKKAARECRDKIRELDDKYRAIPNNRPMRPDDFRAFQA